MWLWHLAFTRDIVSCPTSPKLVFGVMLNPPGVRSQLFPDLGCGRAAGCESAALAAGGERQAFDGYLQPGTLAEPWGPVRGLGLLVDLMEGCSASGVLDC